MIQKKSAVFAAEKQHNKEIIPFFISKGKTILSLI